MNVSTVSHIKPVDSNFRMAPHNAEAENQLLGAILVNNESFHLVSEFLEPEHFYLEPHREIYKKIGQLITSGKVASPVTLQPFYSNDDKIADLPAVQYLLRLVSDATSLINVKDYGQTIYDLSVRRGLINIGEQMVNVAYDTPIDNPPVSQIEDAESRLYELAETGSSNKGFIQFSDALTQTINMAASAYQRTGKLSGISTGFRDLDKRMGGLQSSDLIVLAGRPGMGKTSLATNMAFKIASNHAYEEQSDGTRKTTNGGVVGFFSLEMSAEQLATRIVSEQTEISSSMIRRGEISEPQFELLTEFTAGGENVPIYIEETGGISIASLITRARRLKRQRGLDVIIVDYIQLLSGSARNQGNRVQEVAEITTSLKALAKELNIPIIAISQLSRQVESREGRRPQLADLRESGSIEQDADVVLFVFREEYYILAEEPEQGSEKHTDWEDKLQQAKNRAEIIIAKQRHGPTGSVEMAFHGEYTRFSDFADEGHYPEQMD